MIYSYLKGIVFFIMFVSVTLYFVSKLLIHRALLWAFKKPFKAQYANKIAISWGQTLFKVTPGWKLEIRGKENLPLEGQACIYVANHESAIDILALYFLGVQFRWLAKDTIFKIPGIGIAMRSAAYIPVTRGNKLSHQKALDLSAQAIREGVSMLYFPEGTRNTVGRIQTFKVGAFKLAIEEKVAVVPLLLLGAGNLLKKRSIIPCPATLKIFIFPPMTAQPDEPVEGFTKRVEEFMRLEQDSQLRSHGQVEFSSEPLTPRTIQS